MWFDVLITTTHRTQGGTMLHYTVVFLIIVIIAAVFGFGGIAVGATEIAKILFFVFVILTIISLIMGRKP
jgi:uncharacterized membrane protein YtjA (UPF0391 family)